MYIKDQENTKKLHEKTFLGGFWAETKETNICKMTKKGQKMSFHARKVEIMANIGIMEIVIERHREAESLIFTGDEVIWGIDLDTANLM